MEKFPLNEPSLAGMSDHMVIHATHPFIMNNREVIRQTIQFLAHRPVLSDRAVWRRYDII